MYCAVEQLYRSDLRGKAVAVLSNGDSIIVAANRAGIAKSAPVKKLHSHATH
ncbi:hypothetical protein [Vibrio mytili]|uniref:hypothetical protein n=1 Tax=Vibrio mytili TaxID=50718 RepID=UPI0038B4A23D